MFVFSANAQPNKHTCGFRWWWCVPCADSVQCDSVPHRKSHKYFTLRIRCCVPGLAGKLANTRAKAKHNDFCVNILVERTSDQCWESAQISVCYCCCCFCCAACHKSPRRGREQITPDLMRSCARVGFVSERRWGVSSVQSEQRTDGIGSL